MSGVQISTLTSRTDVTAINFVRGYIFAGIGNCLYITNRTSKSVQVVNAFKKEPVFTIKFSSNADKVLVCGCNTFVIFSFNHNNGLCKKLTSNFYYPDWLLTAEWINNDNAIAAVSMHNKLVIWNCQDFVNVCESVCEERCILYSAHIAGKRLGKLIIFSGTVFNEILIWSPNVKSNELCLVLTTLKGHQGAIFSIDYNPYVGFICSTSDDRSLKVWQTKKCDFSTGMINVNSVKLKHTLHGHSSRVFRCKILENFIIAAGEDSVINLWDFNGKNVGRFKAQDGNCLWAIDYNEDEKEIIVGGSDGGVTILPFDTYLFNDNVHCISMFNREKPIKINYMISDNLAILSDKGSLYYYHKRANKLMLVGTHEELMKYSLMEVSQCRRLLSLCGFTGNIHIYKEMGCDLEYVCFHKVPDLGRVFSFHWLTCNTFLCCSRNGTLSLWELYDPNEVVLRSVFKLPNSQQRCSTAATFCGENHLIVGDRKGNVHLFILDRLYPVQTIKKAHNHLGITHLSYNSINRKVLSLGANGIVKTYDFDRKLSPTCSDKLPMSWLEKLSACDDLLLILSFRGDIFTVWDIKSRRIVVEIKCGGRHRSWDFKTSLNDLRFSYLKDKTVLMNDYKKSSVFPTKIISSFHTKEINACQLILFKNLENYVLISGGEDTTIKISIGCFKTGSLETVSTLKSHLSSIRCIRCIKRRIFGETTEFNLFTAGGRAQIIAWTLRISSENGRIARIDCKQLHSFHETTKEWESETRIMDLSVLKKNDVVYLIAACSDGCLLIFSIKKKNQIKCIHRGCLSKSRCITKLLHEKFLETDMLICTLTSGHVMFVDLRNILNESESEELKQTEYFPFKTFKLHQNAVNSIVLRKMGEKRLLLVTGGDDNMINASLLQVSGNLLSS
ncbi:WD repeat-containing protein 6 isoform X2 [Agrilus planipennis]|uniref:tRNA (34-2'-O)-methyltransferase regulator WDR6 n=1 Tax=Agrilus planipennis TaxID=224129 RepID=A0A1W4X613_AGRPL|nr:WD repeat-containing protein 6 isoform X2 [Agrilus planipennis]